MYADILRIRLANTKMAYKSQISHKSQNVNINLVLKF